jgi:hypothetical protein
MNREILAKLLQPLDIRLLKTLSEKAGPGKAGKQYLPGYEHIRTSNEIFGFDVSTFVLLHDLVVEEQVEKSGKRGWEVLYRCILRVVAGGVSKDGVGMCDNWQSSRVEAHQVAGCGAAMEALKSALEQFGDRFACAVTKDANDPEGKAYGEETGRLMANHVPTATPPPLHAPGAALQPMSTEQLPRTEAMRPAAPVAPPAPPAQRTAAAPPAPEPPPFSSEEKARLAERDLAHARQQLAEQEAKAQQTRTSAAALAATSAPQTPVSTAPAGSDRPLSSADLTRRRIGELAREFWVGIESLEGPRKGRPPQALVDAGIGAERKKLDTYPADRLEALLIAVEDNVESLRERMGRRERDAA